MLCLLANLVRRNSRSAGSFARCDATAKEICINDDVSDVPIEALAAPTTGSGC